MIEENKEVKQTSADYKPEEVHHQGLPQNNSSNLINAFIENNTVEKIEQNEQAAQTTTPAPTTDSLLQPEPVAEFPTNTSAPQTNETNDKLKTLKTAMYIGIGSFVATFGILVLFLTGIMGNMLSYKSYSIVYSIVSNLYSITMFVALGLSIAGTICLEGKARKIAMISLILIVLYNVISPYLASKLASYLISGLYSEL